MACIDVVFWFLMIMKNNILKKTDMDNYYEISQVESPVLLIGFNRSDTMQKVFNEVRKAQPKKLYYAVDGPRVGKCEGDMVEAVRNITKQVDWPCELHTLFRTENVGCGSGPAEAITWAFENEDRLIILEDDCVPSQSFFSFCDEMLERYKDDERVNIVSGRSHWHGSHFFDQYDYIFTRYAHTWGWATWKRCWREFDIRMGDFPQWLEYGGGKNVLITEEIGRRSDMGLKKKYDTIDTEITHSWDSQWVYTRLKLGGLGIVPCHNLIHNIGENGTHTTTVDIMESEEMPSKLRHPLFIVPNREYELYHYKHHILKNRQNIVLRIVRKMFRWLTKD